MGSHRAAHAERDDRVDIQHLLEPLIRHLVDGGIKRVAGVVDQDVHLAPLVDHLLHQLIGHARLCQIAAEDQRLTLDLPRSLLGHVCVEVIDQDLRALLGQELRGGAPDPTGRAGDDRDLAV